MTAIIPEVLPPSGTLSPERWQFVETTYVPHNDVTKDEADELRFNDLLTGLKKQRKQTEAEIKAFLVYYDALIARYKEEQPRGEDGQFTASTRPTLPEAFNAIGLKYEAERKRHQRYLLAAKTPKLRDPKPPSFEEGDFIEYAGEEFVFIGNSEPGKAEIVPLGRRLDDAITVPTDSLARRPVKRVEWNDLVLCIDDNKMYRYTDNGFHEEDNSALLKQKRDRDNAEVAAVEKRSREAAEKKADEKASANSKLQAEVADRDRRVVAEKPNRWPKPPRPKKPEETKAQLEADKNMAEEVRQ
jgi:hypothetical protein